MPLTPTARRREMLIGLAWAVLAWLLVMGTAYGWWEQGRNQKVPCVMQFPSAL